jgi:O-antigen ligase
VLTMSRSGISCLAVAVLMTGSVAIVRRRERSRGGIIATYVVFLLIVAVGWAGSEVVAQRFASADSSEFNNRMGAWKDAWNIALRFMPFGSGLNTYGATTRFYQTIDPRAHYVEAHNDYLQLLAEGGLLVGIPVLITIGAFVQLVWKRFRHASESTMTWWVRVGAVTGILAMALQEVVEFSLQIPGNAVLFVVLIAVAVHEPMLVEKRVRR